MDPDPFFFRITSIDGQVLVDTIDIIEESDEGNFIKSFNNLQFKACNEENEDSIFDEDSYTMSADDDFEDGEYSDTESEESDEEAKTEDVEKGESSEDESEDDFDDDETTLSITSTVVRCLPSIGP